ncbi:protein PROTON GRADIENT REGULATION 5, chloroplastic-like [Cajanus cajan]|uniref:protein PROTON GRADIENT REGULATION 5, chloroplastic-like n=1 Tax=Cajanus cajan TaxID=3821 RepID=UPI0010FB8345|nr:protein PROTON GRADIENT REGULATION 5, chloroplastic-like [Cajanus cajan]XP_029129887.1 protein PROTON GRADIENT REGULATION 5, chloroplastic-like [Cajanus cajan]
MGRGKPVRLQPMMKNVNEGKGIFAPVVVVTRNIIGKKRFNQLRGKAIALHSQASEDAKKLVNQEKSFACAEIQSDRTWMD